ncbi:O-antigen ligase family protein [Poriferisphaera sp. WC338]|uniref:O-antigen ligase family protein n=1 Tax=Poriferisphaera sp. WC338 TaxID=3425129 RepID=UPI003D816404
MPELSNDVVRERSKAEPLTVATVTVVLLALIFLPAVTPFLPVIYLDTLPTVSEKGALPMTFVGPTGYAVLHTLIVFVSAGAIFVAKFYGAVSPRVLMGMLFGAMAVGLYWLEGTYGNAQYASAFVAGISAIMAAIHLVDFALVRRIVVATAVAMLIPFALFSFYFLYVEHPMTVVNFHENEEAFLAARGWAAGSPQHLLYVRRLESPDAVGTFGLANVLGSFAAAFTLIAIGIMFAWMKKGVKWVLPVVVTGAAALLGVVTTYDTHSKGALLVLPLGVGLMVVAYVFRKYKAPGWVFVVCCAGLIALPVVAVMVRGMQGLPESELGERSLLFRYQYWTAAGRMLWGSGPIGLLLGVGPDDFGYLYLKYKSVYSPEEVSSAHNVFVDYVTGYGLAGLLLSVSLVWIVMQSAMRIMKQKVEQVAAEKIEHDGRGNLTGKQVGYLAFMLAGILFLTRYFVTFEEMYLESALLWLVTVVLFAGVFYVLVRRLACRGRVVKLSLLVGAVALLVHNQIEMSFFQLASGPMVCFMVAACYVDERSEVEKKRARSVARRYFVPMLLMVVPLYMVSVQVLPVTAYQEEMRIASEALAKGDSRNGLKALDRAAKLEPTDPLVSRQRIAVRLQLASAFMHRGQKATALKWVEQAREDAAYLIEHRPVLPAGYRQLATVEAYQASITNTTPPLLAAAKVTEKALKYAPYSLNDHLSLADKYWQLAQYQKAAEAYQQAIVISEKLYLDPAKQMTPDEMAQAQKRIRQAEGVKP